ncbi:MAG: hypothetical protein HC809_10555 [Gammaproteobacteria bacterium]|nr:hypothetical protein [Gammaproteobacteria bacterium]
MAELSDLVLAIAQTDAQRKLALATIEYDYRLTCTALEAERGITFEASIDVLGHDLLRDECLVERIDAHLIEASDEPIQMHREITIGQSLLDEDIGVDEIKLRIRVRSDSGDVVDGVTGVVRGRFDLGTTQDRSWAAWHQIKKVRDYSLRAKGRYIFQQCRKKTIKPAPPPTMACNSKLPVPGSK